jgi:hypothetical protein
LRWPVASGATALGSVIAVAPRLSKLTHHQLFVVDMKTQDSYLTMLATLLTDY